MLVKPEAASHWYLPDGTPFYEVEMTTSPGKFRPVNRRDAAKAGAFRSVTNIAGHAKKFELEAWKINQAILAAVTLPRHPSEELGAFCARVVKDMEEEAKQAAALGSELHAAVDTWIQGDTEFALSEKAAMLFAPFPDWWRGWIGEYDDRPLLIDFKTQGKPGDKMACYPDWGMQLVAYAVGIPFSVPNVQTEVTFCNVEERYGGRVDYIARWQADGQGILTATQPPILCNIALSTVQPGVIRVKCWPPETWEDLWRSFCAARELAYGPLYSSVLWNLANEHQS
jgi:hypothetical protein